MRLTATIAALLFAVFVFSINSDSVHAQTESSESESARVTVKQGDTLTRLAKRHETTYPRIFNANDKIKDPNLIYTGDKLRVPEKDEELPDRFAKLRKTARSTTRTQRSVSTRPQAQTRSTQSVVQQESTPSAPVTNTTSTSVWDRVAQCEAGGNWSISTGNGYYGGLQFSLSSWRYVGGSGYPHQASKAEQIKRAEMLLARQGWTAWPACSAKLGLR